MRADGEGGGILFYIILAIVGFILSFLQKKSKPSNDTPIPKDIWEDFPDFDEIERTPEPQPESSQKTVSQKRFIEGVESLENVESVEKSNQLEEIVSDNPYYRAYFEGASVFEYTDEIKKTEIGDYNDSQANKDGFNFNPKLAVIYSEILNRKYF